MMNGTAIRSSPYEERGKFGAQFPDVDFPCSGWKGVNIGFSRPHVHGIAITVETRPQSLADRCGVCSSTTFIYNNPMQRPIAFAAAKYEFDRRIMLTRADCNKERDCES